MTLNQAIHLLHAYFADKGDFTTQQAAAVLGCTVNLASARMIHLANKGLLKKIRPGLFTLDCVDEDEMDLFENNLPRIGDDEEHRAWMKSVMDARKARLGMGQWQQRY